MSFEIPFTGPDGKTYRCSPGRDIAYFWAQIVASAEEACKMRSWDDEFSQFCRDRYVTEDDLLTVASCYFDFCYRALDPDLDTPHKAIEASKFLEQPLYARMAFFYRLGQMTSGAFWAGIKSATPLGEVPDPIAQLLARSKEMVGITP